MKNTPSLFLIITWLLLLTCIGLFTIRSLQAAQLKSVYAAEPCTTPTPTPSTSPSPSPTPTPTPVPVENVYLTEFMACPASGNEWLELYNGNDTPVTVTNWQIVDGTGNKKYLNGEIPANDFLQIQWTGSLLNNTGDSFTVFTDSGQSISTASYDSCTTGISFVYENGTWVGALDTPGESTEISSASFPNSTAAAILSTPQDEVFVTDQVTTDQTFSTNIPSSTATIASHFKIPSLVTAPKQYLANLPPPAPNFSSLPAYSVIIGGLVQLLPSSAILYGNTKKHFT